MNIPRCVPFCVTSYCQPRANTSSGKVFVVSAPTTTTDMTLTSPAQQLLTGVRGGGRRTGEGKCSNSEGGGVTVEMKYARQLRKSLRNLGVIKVDERAAQMI